MTNPNFTLDTTVVPEGVDADIAESRNRLVDQWTSGDITAEAAIGGVATLYWTNQDTATDDTRFFLVDTKAILAVEGEVDSNIAFNIWQAAADED